MGRARELGEMCEPLKVASPMCYDTSTQIPLAKAFHMVKAQVNGEEVYCFYRQITWQWAWIIILQEGGRDGQL